MTSALHHVEHLDIDGVSTFRVDVPGPAFAALLFRVGRCDEPITHAGITHLVEHLAFNDLRHVAYDANGVTESGIVRFFAEGTPDEVHGFVRSIARTLAAPPLERVDREARVLLAEAADRGLQALDLLLRQRCGASPHGRAGFPELGLTWLDGNAVHAWAARRFTRGNVAVVLNGPVPASLGLDVLPDGPRFALPPLSTLELPRPLHLHGPDGIVLATMVVPREVASLVTTAVLERELDERLRHDSGLVYESVAEYLPCDTEAAQLVVGGNVKDDDTADKVAVVLDRALTSIADNGPDPSLFEVAVARMRRGWTDPTHAVGSAMFAAEADLTGLDWEGPEQSYAELEATTPAVVAATLGEALPTRIFSVPEGLDLDEERFGDCTLPSDPSVTGVAFRESGLVRQGRGRLVIGDEAVGIRFGDGRWWSVAYDAVEAVAWYEDGSREVVGPDGSLLPVEPTHWRRGGRAVAMLDERLAIDRYVPGTPQRAADGPPTRHPFGATPARAPGLT